jgi:hypothetical protein
VGQQKTCIESGRLVVTKYIILPCVTALHVIQFPDQRRLALRRPALTWLCNTHTKQEQGKSHDLTLSVVSNNIQNLEVVWCLYLYDQNLFSYKSALKAYTQACINDFIDDNI